MAELKWRLTAFPVPSMDRISKVAVEYYDPSGVYPLISQELQSRFPLRNLHWKSGDRPLRSIEFLHVELLQGQEFTSNRPLSQQSTQTTDGPVKERRHQIPGLRQTPYLKIYLLRCDDAETYRESARKNLREWLKTHVPPAQKSSSNAQENHDAFDWMILHVILPNTSAASQPRFSGSDSKNEGGPPEKSGPRLKLGRSSNTLLEKIRADFNVSGKAAPDRVAQIRLQSDDIPHHLLPPKIPTEPGLNETPQERANAWNDTVNKLKLLILASFDLRVRQYEDDIRERGSQRSLPGWNFCTFSILKEGLARGFESAGLLDDALLGYDELAAELDSVIRDQGVLTGFLPSTPGFQELLDNINGAEGERTAIWGTEDRPISTDRKAYRELILANNISVFDFKCYLFARQKDILLRMGIPHSSEIASIQHDSKRRGQAPIENEDLPSLSELCRRTSTFIPEISRVLREDLEHIKEGEESNDQKMVIEHIDASWTYAVATQILEETGASALTARIAAAKSGMDMSNTAVKHLPPSHPPRSSSLSSRSPIDQTYEQIPEDESMIFDNLATSDSTTSTLNKVPRGALEELAGHRAELLLLQRQVLSRLATKNGWPVGWKAYENLQPPGLESMNEVDLDDDAKSSDGENQIIAPRKEMQQPTQMAGICVQPLLGAMKSFKQCLQTFKDLTSKATNHYLAAKSTKAVERLMADLAVLRFQNGDYSGAGNLLARITPLYGEREWHQIETPLLRIHAQCLKMLHRRDDHVRMLLTILQSSVTKHKASNQLKGIPKPPIPDSQEEQLVSELLTHSEALPYELSAPMSAYFANIVIDPFLRHIPDQDGFQIRLKFFHLLGTRITFQRVRLWLKSLAGGASLEVVLENLEPVEVRPGAATIVLSTNTNVCGIFQVERATLLANKVCFLHEDFQTEYVKYGRPVDRMEKPKKLSILCYPKPDALDASITHCRTIHIDKARSIEIECRNGLSNVRIAHLRLRSASAGLRIKTADTKVINGTAKVNVKSEPGVIEVADLEASSSIRLGVPYSLDSDMNEITMRLEISYHTSDGEFKFLSVATIPVSLALDVNVHDLFKCDVLYSKFNIKTSNNLPLEVLDMQLHGTDVFAVEAPPRSLLPMVISEQQPAPMLFKITLKPQSDASPSLRHAVAKELPLTLEVQYQSIQEMMLRSARRKLKEALQNSTLDVLSRLLEHELESRLLSTFSLFDYEVLASTKELTTPSFTSLDWQSLLILLPPPLNEKLSVWLQNWHQTAPKIALEASEANDLRHRLTITVPVPRLHILHTVSLSVSRTAQYHTTGSPIPATVKTSHTRKWESQDAFERIAPDSGRLEFTLELDASPDQWLIAGLRRTRFAANEGEVATFPVTLVPLKPGCAPLPSVEIRMASQEFGDISCVTEYKDIGEIIHVINDVGSSTVSLKDGLHGPEALLVAMTQRK